MKRKQFLSSLFPLVLSFNARSEEIGEEYAGASSCRIPLYLRKGDVIGITSPAGYISAEDIQPSLERISDWGFEVHVGETIGKRDFTFGGTDEQRLADMQYMLDSPEIKAVLCARGGYGLTRIIDKLNFSRFTRKPKWIIGFSDITVMHSHINRRFQIATIHSKMCNSFPQNWEEALPVQKESILKIRDCLVGLKMKYESPPDLNNVPGNAVGQLVGGNLRCLESLTGTVSDLFTVNKILFLEDTGEYLYNLDRMLGHFDRMGKLSKLKGLIIGGFKVKEDDSGEEFGKTIGEIVLEKVKKYNFPVCFGFPVGHMIDNFPLKCGVAHKLRVDKQGSVLQEL